LEKQEEIWKKEKICICVYYESWTIPNPAARLFRKWKLAVVERDRIQSSRDQLWFVHL